MPTQHETTKSPPATFKEIAWGCVCLFLIFFYLYSCVNNFFNPPRSERLKDPFRETRTVEEKKVRQIIEECAHAAVWQGNQVEEYPLQFMGPEPKLDISMYDFCNKSDRNLKLLFDGAEIFEVQVQAGASIEVELKSGEYELLIVAPGGLNKDKMMLAPLYRRMSIKGTYHDQLVAGEGPERRCPGIHPLIRHVE